METDFGFWRFRRGQQERAEFLVDVAEGDIVREQGFVNFRQTLENGSVCSKVFTQFYERANDVQTYRDGAWTIEDVGRLQCAVFGESPRPVGSATTDV
jgi:hypothetical protein